MDTTILTLCQNELKTEQLKILENKTDEDKSGSTTSTSNLKESVNVTPTIPIGRVYLITNLTNGKRYVGITTRTLRERFNEHIADSNRRAKKPLHLSIKKYGKENFKLELLEEIFNITEKELHIKETFYIDKYNTFVDGDCGYNLVKCSDESLIISESTRKKMSENNVGEKNKFYGKHHTEESKKKIGGSVVDYSGNKNPFFGKTHTKENRQKFSDFVKTFQSGKNHPRLGKSFTKESREKMSKSHLGVKLSDETKKRLSISLKGKFTREKCYAFIPIIRHFKNLTTNEEFVGTQYDFMIKYGIKRGSITALMKGRLKSLKGWMLMKA